MQVPDDAGGIARVEAAGLTLQLAAPYAVWGENSGRFESGHDDKTAWLDVVLYSGPERAFQLDELEHAALGVALQIGGAPMAPLRATPDGERLSLEWDDLQVVTPLRPAPEKQLRALVAR